jgi:hypothetical protein
VEWNGDQELLAWRGWRLGLFVPDAGEPSGPRLLSITAPCIWNGPVVKADRPRDAIDTPSGIYALKADVADRSQLRIAEGFWATGLVALSGRVVEHAIGYRAQRAVVRELRLGVGTHFAVRSLQRLRLMMESLEDRYQVAVDVGQSEREIADRMIMYGKRPQCPKLPFVYAKSPWRLI